MTTQGLEKMLQEFVGRSVEELAAESHCAYRQHGRGAVVLRIEDIEKSPVLPGGAHVGFFPLEILEHVLLGPTFVQGRVLVENYDPTKEFVVILKGRADDCAVMLAPPRSVPAEAHAKQQN